MRANKIAECEHEDIAFFDDEDRGECLECHATCDWHWEKDIEDFHPEYREIVTRVIDGWYSLEER